MKQELAAQGQLLFFQLQDTVTQLCCPFELQSCGSLQHGSPQTEDLPLHGRSGTVEFQSFSSQRISAASLAW
jgi:hypothetical protein